MRAVVILKSKESLPRQPEIFSVGGFTAVTKDGREFCFDFKGSGTWVNCDNAGIYVFSTTLKGRDIEVFIESNSENGVEDSEITGEFIAQSSLTELNYECYLTADDEIRDTPTDLSLVKFTIYENGMEYSFPTEMIEVFNALETTSVLTS